VYNKDLIKNATSPLVIYSLSNTVISCVERRNKFQVQGATDVPVRQDSRSMNGEGIQISRLEICIMRNRATNSKQRSAHTYTRRQSGGLVLPILQSTWPAPDASVEELEVLVPKLSNNAWENRHLSLQIDGVNSCDFRQSKETYPFRHPSSEVKKRQVGFDPRALARRLGRVGFALKYSGWLLNSGSGVSHSSWQIWRGCKAALRGGRESFNREWRHLGLGETRCEEQWLAVDAVDAAEAICEGGDAGRIGVCFAATR